MFNIGGGELIVIALIALIVLGPNRLPGAARKAGEVLGDLRRISTGFQNEIRTALTDAEREAADRDGAAEAALVPPVPAGMPDPPDLGGAFAAVSSGDNSNIIAARVARETFGVENVVARIYDYGRAEVYQKLGIPTVATVRARSR